MAGGAGLRAVTTLARLAGRGALKALKPRPAGPEGGASFAEAFRKLTGDPAVAARIRALRLLDLGADGMGWTDIDLDVGPGDEVTVIGAGTLWASKALDMRFGPRIGLWLRAGDEGTILKTPSAASTVRLAEGGPLFIVAKPPGEWADEHGRFDPAFPRGGLSGAISVCVIVWNDGALGGLEAMARVGDHGGLVAQALERARRPVPAPEGWRYLWRLGEGEIYREAKERERRICCHTHEDVGILQFPAEFPLGENTELRWRWKVDRRTTISRSRLSSTTDRTSPTCGRVRSPKERSFAARFPGGTRSRPTGCCARRRRTSADGFPRRGRSRRIMRAPSARRPPASSASGSSPSASSSAARASANMRISSLSTATGC
jgi:hypothetical protein